MTLPTNLKNEAEKAATISVKDMQDINGESYDSFLAGVQWLFTRLTKAPEGFEYAFVFKDDYEEIIPKLDLGDSREIKFYHYPPTAWVKDMIHFIDIAALASLRAENELQKEKTAEAVRFAQDYVRLDEANKALLERVKELEKDQANNIRDYAELRKWADSYMKRNADLTSALEKVSAKLKEVVAPEHYRDELTDGHKVLFTREAYDISRQALKERP